MVTSTPILSNVKPKQKETISLLYIHALHTKIKASLQVFLKATNEQYQNTCKLQPRGSHLLDMALLLLL